MQQALIALGANIGSESDSFAHVRQVFQAEPKIEVIKCSSLYRTMPVGEQAGGQFVNAAISIRTDLSPIALLEFLQQTEKQLGREKTIHWGPRIIDLDLILYSDRIVRESRLNVPHPACWYRRFVLAPSVEIAPDAIHPVKKVSLKELLSRLDESPLSLSIAGGNAKDKAQLLTHMTSRFPSIECSTWGPESEGNASQLPTIVAWLGPNADHPAVDRQSERFEDLPLLPRLDLTQTSESPSKSLQYVIEAAIDEPVRVGELPTAEDV